MWCIEEDTAADMAITDMRVVVDMVVATAAGMVVVTGTASS
jgi:hypothetical protein